MLAVAENGYTSAIANDWTKSNYFVIETLVRCLLILTLIASLILMIWMMVIAIVCVLSDHMQLPVNADGQPVAR